jgi:hypothetical protein
VFSAAPYSEEAPIWQISRFAPDWRKIQKPRFLNSPANLSTAAARALHRAAWQPILPRPLELSLGCLIKLTRQMTDDVLKAAAQVWTKRPNSGRVHKHQTFHATGLPDLAKPICDAELILAFERLWWRGQLGEPLFRALLVGSSVPRAAPV